MNIGKETLCHVKPGKGATTLHLVIVGVVINNFVFGLVRWCLFRFCFIRSKGNFIVSLRYLFKRDCSLLGLELLAEILKFRTLCKV